MIGTEFSNTGRAMPLKALAPILVAGATLTLSACGSGASVATEGERIPGPSTEVVLVETLRTGTGEPLFGRVSDVAIASDGSIYVADSGTLPMVYRFDEQGDYVGTVGAKGEGPGEYGRPQMIFPEGDSIVVYDAYYGKLVVYEPDGSPRRKTERLSQVTAANPVSLGLLGRFGDGYVGVTQRVGMPGMEVGEPEDYMVLSVDGNAVPRDTMWSIAPREILIVSSERSVSMMMAPFGRSTLCAFGQERAYCAWTAALDFDVYARDGSERPPLNVAYTPVPITAAEKAVRREDVRELFQPLLDMPDDRPALIGLTISERDNLWAKVEVGAGDDESHFWIVDPVSRTVAEAVVDGNLNIMDVRDGRACGVLTSTEQEQFVTCYAVESYASM